MYSTHAQSSTTFQHINIEYIFQKINLSYHKFIRIREAGALLISMISQAHR